MTLYTDDTAIRDHATAVAGRAARRKSRVVWSLASVGTVLAGGAAFAAVQLFGFGSIDAQAATLKNLGTTNVRLAGTLVPGRTVDGRLDVGNQNDFDVVVTAVILQDSSLHGSGGSCDEKTLTPGGTAVPAYPGAGGGSGHQITLTAGVPVPAGQTRTITVPDVVSQAAGASALCGVKASFAVVATVGR